MKSFLPALLLCIAGLCTRAQNIIPNPSFGQKGVATKNATVKANVLTEGATSVTELSDGKLLVAVEIYSSKAQTRLTRYLPDGTQDKSYGKDGFSERFNATQARLMLTKDGKVFVTGVESRKSANLLLACYDENGRLSTTFGNSGITSIPTAALNNDLKAVALQPDGKVLLAGSQAYTDRQAGFVMRLLPNGNPDPFFAKGGLLTVDIPGISAVSGLAVSGTKIILGSMLSSGGGSDFAIMQYKEDGKPDFDFGNSGLARINIMTADVLKKITLQSDGKIIVGGGVGHGSWSMTNFTLARLLPTGHLDRTFNNSGFATVEFRPDNHALELVKVDENGRLLVGGILHGSSQALAFARLSNDGSLDKSFGDGGRKLVTIAGNSYTELTDGVVLSDGSLFAVGSKLTFGDPYTNRDFMLVHLNTNGQPNGGSVASGVTTAFTPAKRYSINQPKLFKDGGLLVRYFSPGDPVKQGLIRLSADGTTDGTFGEKGVLPSGAFLFHILPDQRIVTLETAFDNTQNTSTVVMRRYTKEGKPDLSFGNSGQKILSLGTNANLNALALQPDGMLLLSGNNVGPNYRQQGFLVRLDKDGNKDSQFGVDGEVLFAAGNYEQPTQVVVQADGKIVVVGFYQTPPVYNSQFFVRRLTPNGTVDEGFGTDGSVYAPGGTHSFVNRIVALPDKKLLLAGMISFDNRQFDGMLFQYNEDGTPDRMFGKNGMVQTENTAATALKNGKILIAARQLNQTENLYDAALILLNQNGSVDKTFGTNGTRVFRLSDEDDSFYDIIAKDDKVFAVGVKSAGLDEEAVAAGFLVQYPPPLAASIAGFQLVNATTNKIVKELKEGDVIDLSTLSGAKLNIRANSTPGKVGSVVFELQGSQWRVQVENLLPYALFGDDMKGRFHGASLPVGEYTLTATPYSETGGKGSIGMPLSVQFKVVYPAAVTRFTLVDAATGKEVRDINGGDVLDVLSLPAKLNIKAKTTSGFVGSVVFNLRGATAHKRIENGVPYTLFGNQGSNYFSGKLPPDDYLLTATPYSEAKGEGGTGSPLTTHFRVFDPTSVRLLYGLTSGGGAHNTGVLFSVNAGTGAYTRLKDIGGNDGKYTNGSLMQASDGKLYGTTLQDQYGLYGNLFSFDPATGGYTTRATFSFSNGASPVGRLVQAPNGKLYGMTQTGGNHGYGVLYSFDPLTNHLDKIKEFNGNDGFGPTGSLVLAADGKLYGMTRSGGSNGFGVIFSFDPETNAYQKRLDFNGNNGGYPYGSLIQATDGKLYGMSYGGGNRGVIFSFDPITGTVVIRKHFNDTDGAYPWGDLVQATDGKLYGMTNAGGSHNLGVLFSLDPETNEYGKFLDFTGANGSNPLGSLIQASDGKLYGGTTYGGSSNLGVLFSFNPATNIYVKLKEFDRIDGANPGYTSLLELSCKATIYYRDADGDGYGDPAKKRFECTPSAPEGYVLKGGDCNDADATAHPGALETCNGVDDSCNGFVDEGCYTRLSFTLVNASTGKDIKQLQEGEVIDLTTLPSGGVNIRANPDPSPAGSVVFALGGAQVHQQTENLLPYALFGDDTKGKYHTWTPKVGSYQLNATPFTGQKGTGVTGTVSTINFSVVNESYTLNSTAIKTGQEPNDRSGETASLHAAPNPFSSQSTVRFSVVKSSYAILGVYDQRGVAVAKLYQGQMESGRTYQATFNGKGLSAGVYVLRLTTEEEVKTLKVVLVR